MAFPWLFPGGIGDINDYRRTKIDIAEWAKKWMEFKDGRFVKDKIFCFYVLNYVVRHRNQTRGNFFVRNFYGTKEEITIEDVKTEIENGNQRFLNDIAFIIKQIKGSDAYWRAKRAELTAWVTHHIEMGNGAPNYFGTLSCAEYWWPDIYRLIEKKIYIETGQMT